MRSTWTEEWDRPDTARQLINYFVGQAVGQMNTAKPAAQVVFDMVESYIDAATRLGSSVSTTA